MVHSFPLMTIFPQKENVGKEKKKMWKDVLIIFPDFLFSFPDFCFEKKFSLKKGGTK